MLYGIKTVEVKSMVNQVTLSTQKNGDRPPDIIIKQSFKVAFQSFADYVLDHNGKEEGITSVDNDYDVLYNNLERKKGQHDNFAEYVSRHDVTVLEDGVESNLLPVFNNKTNNMTLDDFKTTKNHLSNAAKRHNIMWQTSISFSDEFLIEEGLMDNAVDRRIDQQRMKDVIRKRMPYLLESEGISESAEWFGAIHLRGDINDKHVHIHVATFEPGETKRPMVYNKFTGHKEPRGKMVYRNLDNFKKGIWRNIRKSEFLLRDRDIEFYVDHGKKDIREKFANQLIEYRELSRLNELIRALPENKKLWRAKSNAMDMRSANALAYGIVEEFLAGNGQSDFDSFKLNTEKLQEIYETGFGESKKNYSVERIKTLKELMVNQIYKEIKALPPEAFDKAISVELESLSHEELQRRKEQLEAKIIAFKDNEKGNLDNVGRIKLKQLKKQSGLIKSIIKRQNLTADLETNNDELNQYRELFFSGIEGNEAEFVNFKINQLSDQNRLIQLQLKPTKTLTLIEKQQRDTLRQSKVNIHQLSPDKMLNDQYKLLKENRLKEIELRQKLKIKDFKNDFGLPGDIKLNVEVITKLQDEIKILDLKKNCTRK